MQTVLTISVDTKSERTQIADGTFMVAFPYPKLTVHHVVVPEPIQTPECTPDMVHISDGRWTSKRPVVMAPIEHPMAESWRR